ncbi:MAG: HAD family hydrolase [Alkalispirochaeta sp.]
MTNIGDLVFDIDAIVFDLDGTLYPGYATLDFYLDHVLTRGGLPERRDEVRSLATAILDGVHQEIRMGEFVRGTPGTEQFARLVPEEYRDIGENGWTYLGDGWTVVHYLTRSYGIPRELYIEAFHQSRYAMSRGELPFVPSPLWRETFDRLRAAGVFLVMQTNSSEDSGIPTLEYLGIADTFDEYIYSAEKPTGMEMVFRRLREERGVEAERILSVGDHPWNDIDSARRLGGRTLLISPFRGFDSAGFEPRIHGEDELLSVLLRIGEERARRRDATATDTAATVAPRGRGR